MASVALVLAIAAVQTPARAEDGALLTLARDEAGLRVAGTLADASVERRLLAAGRTLAGQGRVALSVTLGRDAPAEARIARALRGLSLLTSGSAAILPEGGRIEGVAETPEAVEAVRAALPGWDVAVSPGPDAPPAFRFVATRTPDGIAYRGTAPDPDTAAALRRVAAEAGAEGGLAVRPGVPAPDAAEQVAAGLAALGLAESGRLVVDAAGVRLEAVLADTARQRRFAERLGLGWQVDVTLLDPAPAADFSLTIADGGALTARGRLPTSVRLASLSEMVGPIATAPSGVSQSDAPGGRAWQAAFDGVSIAVPRMRRGEIALGSGEAVFSGALKAGFSASDLGAALRATLGPDWELVLDLAEAPPAAWLVIDKGEGGLDVSGILPQGAAAEALMAAAGPADLEDMTGGGVGDGPAWSHALRVVGEALGVIEAGKAELAAGRLEVSGRLKAGQPKAVLLRWLKAELGPDWQVSLDVRETAGEDGDRRFDLATGLVERLTGGHWLPVHAFAPAPEPCARTLARTEADGRLGFVPGKATLGRGQERQLDRLAGVIGHCLSGTRLRLEIAGHTDDEGDEDGNLELSRLRAEAVLTALADRGIPASRLTATGFGETMPVADNATAEGRALNRRIGFRWIAEETAPTTLTEASGG